jgi:triosephosphate isomerase
MKWIGTSWKMNKTLAEALEFADGLLAHPDPRLPQIQRFVIPPFTTARQVRERLAGSCVKVGAQTMHWADSGAWTGEISAPMLVDCGLDMVELGHSERRTHFGETDETVGLKVAAALRHGLIPLVCVGETLAEREAGLSEAVLIRQTRAALARIDSSPAIPVLMAYEPVWAIGENGIPATTGYAEAMHNVIRETARSVIGQPLACLYGGSVNPENAADLAASTEIDGLFIGRSAWAVDGYLDILRRVTGALQKEAIP